MAGTSAPATTRRPCSCARASYDGAEPSGHSVTTLNLLRLHTLTQDARWRVRAERSLASVGRALKHGGAGMPKMASALDYYLDDVVEIVLVRAPGDEAGASALLAVLRGTFVPNRMLAVVDGEEGAAAVAERLPLVAGKGPRAGRSTAFVCFEGVCQLPTSEPEALRAQLLRMPARPATTPAPAPVARPPGP